MVDTVPDQLQPTERAQERDAPRPMSDPHNTHSWQSSIEQQGVSGFFGNFSEEDCVPLEDDHCLEHKTDRSAEPWPSTPPGTRQQVFEKPVQPQTQPTSSSSQVRPGLWGNPGQVVDIRQLEPQEPASLPMPVVDPSPNVTATQELGISEEEEPVNTLARNFANYLSLNSGPLCNQPSRMPTMPISTTPTNPVLPRRPSSQDSSRNAPVPLRESYLTSSYPQDMTEARQFYQPYDYSSEQVQFSNTHQPAPFNRLPSADASYFHNPFIRRYHSVSGSSQQMQSPQQRYQQDQEQLFSSAPEPPPPSRSWQVPPELPEDPQQSYPKPPFAHGNGRQYYVQDEPNNMPTVPEVPKVGSAARWSRRNATPQPLLPTPKQDFYSQPSYPNPLRRAASFPARPPSSQPLTTSAPPAIFSPQQQQYQVRSVANFAVPSYNKTLSMPQSQPRSQQSQQSQPQPQPQAQNQSQQSQQAQFERKPIFTSNVLKQLRTTPLGPQQVEVPAQYNNLSATIPAYRNEQPQYPAAQRHLDCDAPPFNRQYPAPVYYPPLVEREEAVSLRQRFVIHIHEDGTITDPRTTLMIKNIPNKYTQKMLLEEIDRNHFGAYDFFYLPIDFKNKCNVGYAFINMISTERIATFYCEFSHTRWSRFNSEKICQVSYARIQGLTSLIEHFKSSSLLAEEEKVRPVMLLNGQLQPFPVGVELHVLRVGYTEVIVTSDQLPGPDQEERSERADRLDRRGRSCV